MTDTTLTTADIAKKLGTTGRTLRRYLRSQEEGVGTGKRYEFTSDDLTDIKKGFAAWRKEVEASKGAETHACPHCDRDFKSASGLASTPAPTAATRSRRPHDHRRRARPLGVRTLASRSKP